MVQKRYKAPLMYRRIIDNLCTVADPIKCTRKYLPTLARGVLIGFSLLVRIVTILLLMREQVHMFTCVLVSFHVNNMMCSVYKADCLTGAIHILVIVNFHMLYCQCVSVFNI